MSRASVGWQQTIGELGLRSSAEAADYRCWPTPMLAALDARGVGTRRTEPPPFRRHRKTDVARRFRSTATAGAANAKAEREDG